MTEASVALWRKSCRNYAGVFMLDSVVIFVSGDSLVPLLIIMKLFLWSGGLVVFILVLRGFSH